MSLVDVSGLRVELSETGADIVDDVSFSVDAGELVGLIGETGSGKTTVASTLLGMTRRGARIAGGSVIVDGHQMLGTPEEVLRKLRGKLVAYVPQDPATALNPALRIGTQLREVLDAHGLADSKDPVQQRINEVLAEVGLPAGENILHRFPHQLSGGQQQRVCIAMAFIARPRVLVFDEPTTALDVTTQAHVLSTIKELCSRNAVAALYVTHDLAVVAGIARRVIVMYAGRLVEIGSHERVFGSAGHPYTRRLIAAIPDVMGRRELRSIPGHAPLPGQRPGGCSFRERCSHAIDRCATNEPELVALGPAHYARCLRTAELRDRPVLGSVTADGTARTARGETVLSIEGLSAFYGAWQALHDLSIAFAGRECVALVGESGSGKTTLARAIVGLHPDYRGEVRLGQELLEPRARHRPASARRSVQYIFQSPYSSLNPRRTIGQSVAMPLRHFFELDRHETRERVEQALARVAFPPWAAAMYPDQLSGGERQRAAIARALVCEPTLLICDEITSALDVSVQASIVQLLNRLQEEVGLAMIFVTHNLALVRSIADRLIVLKDGRIVESGSTAAVLDQPAEAYTRELIDDTPLIEPQGDAEHYSTLQIAPSTIGRLRSAT